MMDHFCCISGCRKESAYQCSVETCTHGMCDEHLEANWANDPPVWYCPEHYEAWNASLQDGKVGEAGAVVAFMGWLTSRKTVSGPFSAKHEASQAAELAGKFCEMQGWEITDDNWHRHLKPYKE